MKRKIHIRTGHKGQVNEYMYIYTLSLTLYLDVVRWPTPLNGCTILKKCTWYSIQEGKWSREPVCSSWYTRELFSIFSNFWNLYFPPFTHINKTTITTNVTWNMIIHLCRPSLNLRWYLALYYNTNIIKHIFVFTQFTSPCRMKLKFCFLNLEYEICHSNKTSVEVKQRL